MSVDWRQEASKLCAEVAALQSDAAARNLDLLAFFSGLGIATPEEGFGKAPRSELVRCIAEAKRMYEGKATARLYRCNDYPSCPCDSYEVCLVETPE